MQSQQQADFEKIKDSGTKHPVLKYYDVREEVTIQCGASEVWLGATIKQHGQPVAFASRALWPAEQRYAQIRKECLAFVFARERFNQYIFGRDLETVQSNQNPLETIFKKPLLSTPKRAQRLLLRLQKCNIAVAYTKGSNMFIVDTLTRASIAFIG